MNVEMACVVSLMNEGSEETMSVVRRVSKLAICSVGQAHAETMGRPGLLGLCILGRR